MNAIKLLRNSESLEYLELLDPIINNSDTSIRDAAIAARIELLYLNDRNKAFSYLIDCGAKIPPLLKNTIENMNLGVDKELLFKAMDGAEVSARRFSAHYLRKSKLLSKDICHKLLKDTDAGVRKEGLLGLIELDEKVDMDMARKLFPEQQKSGIGLLGYGLLGPQIRPDKFVPLLLRKCDPNKLLSQLDFFDLYNDQAYRVLGLDHFTILEPRIRYDLDQNFESLRSESEVRLREKYGEGTEIIIKKYEPEVIEFIRAKYISAALDGLAKNGKRQDVKYARKYLVNTQYNLANYGAINILSRFGDSSDVERLIEVASNTYGETKRIALETAVNLSENKDVLLEKLINNDDETIAKLAVQILAEHETKRKVELARGLLKSKTDRRRLEGLAILFRCYDLNGVEKLLDVYLAQKSYYYNIVTWIDRCLYAKGRYSKFFRTKLSRMTEED